MKLRYILFTFFIGSLFGCKKDFLDITPKGQLIPTTTADYRLILDFVGNKNSVGQKKTVLITYGVVNLLADDYQISDSTEYKAMITTDRKLWFQWGKNGGYNAELDDPDWYACYGQIYIMNNALEGLPTATGPQSDKDELIAEAKFHRAFCFLGLVNIYSKHYNPASAATDLGVPLRLTTSLTESLKRASVKETYDLIIADLEAAIPNLLPTQGIYNFRPTTAAAYALLARAYLYMGNYQKALQNATASLGVTNFLYDYNVALTRIFPVGTSTTNNAFDAAFRSWDDKEILVQKETAYNVSLYFYRYATIWGPTVRALYDTATDLRFSNYFRKTTTGPGLTFAGHIRRWQDAVYFMQVGLTTPEMYLTRAECYARLGLGDKVNAITDLNSLRIKRYITGTYTPYNAANYTDAQTLQLVKEERRRELWCRGLRWFDLRRYNAFDNANYAPERYFTTDKLMPADKGWVMPIGQLYIDQNPEIIQN
ncbi:MAG: RagB/SusD family nutrient uptake outer membrane protein [Bacteroidota bacterium]|nr:RagB/SusD family nutrient uptake outer membrane protein [Bacteroidota bacterium]